MSSSRPAPHLKPLPWATPWAPLALVDVPAVTNAGPDQVPLMQGDVRCSANPAILTTNDRYGEKSTRYGDVAIDELEAGLLRLGCRMADLQAKVFGGAAVLPFAGGETVGSNNVRLALERLSRDRIRIVARRTGGILGQQVRFHTTTGDAFVRYIPAGIRGGFPAAVAGPGPLEDFVTESPP